MVSSALAVQIKRLLRDRREVEIVIPERVILCRIENFEQRCGWIATEIAPVYPPRPASAPGYTPHPTYGLQDAPRQCTNIRAPVAAQFRFIVHAA